MRLPPLCPPAGLLAGPLLALLTLACSGGDPAASVAGAAGAAGGGGAAGAAGGGAAGASAGAGGKGDPFEGFQPLSCGDAIEGLAALLGVDGLGLDRRQDKVWAPVKTDGALCGGAADPAGCQAKLAAAREASAESTLEAQIFPWNDRPRDRLVATRGDEVLVATDSAGLLALLGPVDDTKKMALWVPYQLPMADPCGLLWKATDGPPELWALRIVMDVCPVIVQDERYRLGPDGALERLESGAWKGSDSCSKLPP